MTKYAYNDAGFVTRRKRLDGSETFASLGIAYDAAGRLVREGSKTYRYGYLDKVMSVQIDQSDSNSQLTTYNSQLLYTFTYHADGQLASATVGGGHRTPRDRVGLSHQMWRRTYDHLWDSLKVTIGYDIVVDNLNLVNIVVKSISSDYTGTASIVGSVTIPIPYGGGSSLTLSRNYAIGWDAPTITRNSGVDNLGRAWNDETMILHLKVYEVSAFTVTPSLLDNFSKQLKFEGEVKATKDVRLYGKAVE